LFSFYFVPLPSLVSIHRSHPSSTPSAPRPADLTSLQLPYRRPTRCAAADYLRSSPPRHAATVGVSVSTVLRCHGHRGGQSRARRAYHVRYHVRQVGRAHHAARTCDHLSLHDRGQPPPPLTPAAAAGHLLLASLQPLSTISPVCHAPTEPTWGRAGKGRGGAGER
jgi:hypothetical protein